MLASTWFFLWGLLWAMYFMLDGFDLGAGMVMPLVAKTDAEKRLLLNAGGPFWDANEVWLISAGGVTFAAFPLVYATMFSGLYTALMLLLFSLIMRAVSYEFRSQLPGAGWRSMWDNVHVVSSFLPALLLGVAFANIFKGIPIDQNHVFQGGLLTLLNPYGLAGGIFFVVLFAFHGCVWLSLRTTGDLQKRSLDLGLKIWPMLVALVLIFLVLTAALTQLFANYLKQPILFAVLLLPVGGLLLARVWLSAGKFFLAWWASAVTIIGVTFFGVIGLFPALLPSSLNPAWSLTVDNASSSPLTLKIMLTVVLIFVPLVLLYQIWVYKTFATKLTETDLDYEQAY